MTDYLAYYDLETWLFCEVSAPFHEAGQIGAFDFFSIVIWKANRAKSKTARRLLRIGREGGMNDLDAICKAITRGLRAAARDRDQLQLLIDDWEFALPMASAILTVLYPKRFSVYDYRVCQQLGNYRHLAYAAKCDDTLWNAYQDFLGAVRNAVPSNVVTLRDCDRFLTGRSMAADLEKDIQREFGHLPAAGA